MKKYKNYPSPNIYKIYLVLIAMLFTSILFSACNKDTAGTEINLATNLLADKTWYLEYTQTTTSAGTNTRTYVGQSTYFVNFLKNKTTVDSDGLTGTYTVEKINNQLQVHVQAHTSNGNAIEYVYNIESLGAKKLVMHYTINTVLTKYYYSSSK